MHKTDTAADSCSTMATTAGNSARLIAGGASVGLAAGIAELA
jgi:hypothetical protein